MNSYFCNFPKRCYDCFEESEEYILWKVGFLGIILLVAILAKNQSLMLAAAFVLIMKLIPTSRSFSLGFKAKESILV